MAIREKNATERVQAPKRVYDKQYLEGFGRSLEKYRKDVTLSDGRQINILDWDTIYLKAGVKGPNGGLTWYYDNGEKKFLMEKFDEVFRQYNAMMYGHDMALDQLDKTAEAMGAEKDFNDY